MNDGYKFFLFDPFEMDRDWYINIYLKMLLKIASFQWSFPTFSCISFFPSFAAAVYHWYHGSVFTVNPGKYVFENKYVEWMICWYIFGQFWFGFVGISWTENHSTIIYWQWY